MESSVFVLASGGIDSTACISYYLSRGNNVSSLFIDYGQKYASQERSAVESISNHYGINNKEIIISGNNFPNGYIPARNAMLLSIALMVHPNDSGIIATGIHSGTPYTDCSPAFEQAMQRIFDIYESGKIQIDAPFLLWEKKQIIDFAQETDVPMHLIFSTDPSVQYAI